MTYVLLTRAPVDPEGPLDLHVLGMPPAFVLSQDQTLRCVELDLNFYCVSDSSVVVVLSSLIRLTE